MRMVPAATAAHPNNHLCIPRDGGYFLSPAAPPGGVTFVE